MTEGLVVCFEGIEKCGKETQSKFLKQYLTDLKIPFEFGREPGGTSYGEAERRSLQDPLFIQRINRAYAGIESIPQLNTAEKLCPASEVLGYLKARAQFFNYKVKPVYNDGRFYVLDRSGDSTIAYQGFGLFGGDEKIVNLIVQANRFAMCDVPIHRTWLLDITVDEMYARKDHNEFGTSKDRIEQRDQKYFERVRKGYLWISRQEPERVMVVDGKLSAGKIFEIVKKDLRSLLQSHCFVKSI